MQFQRQVFVFSSAWCLLISFLALPGSGQFQSSTMQLVSNSSGPLCAADPATTVSQARSLMDCHRQCTTQKNKCYASNFYSDTKSCEIYNFKPTTFTNSRKNNCQLFKNTNFWIDTPSALAPRDCADIRKLNFTTNGTYTVYLNGSISQPLSVYCDMTTSSVGWTVFQRRQDGSVDFYLNWTDYQTGFGNISGEFWIGNDNLHLLTSAKRYKLRVELTDFNGSTVYAEFNNFKVDSAAAKYNLSSIGSYSGTAIDSLTNHVGKQFSTKDQDNDQYAGGNCAVNCKGAWWYNNCQISNLNGHYYSSPKLSLDGVSWNYWKNTRESLKRSEMKITPFV